MPKTKTIIIFSIIFFGVLVFTKSSLAAVIFENGWERASGIGCTAPQGELDLHITDLTGDGWSDPGGWDADHSINPCGLYNGYPAMSTVSSLIHSGTRSFRYHCPKDIDAVNGRGGVILKTFDSNWPNGGSDVSYPEIYIRYYVRWDSNFRFVDADYKSTFARMSNGQHTYNSYYGQPGDNLHGRLRFGWWGGVSVAPWSTNITLNRDQWYCMEWHHKYGAAGVGFTEAKVDGTLVEWTDGYGTKVYIESVDYSYLAQFSAFSLDNTINGYYDGTFQNAIPADAFIYYDDVVVNNGDGWIGCGGALDITPPAPPNGVNVS